MKKALFNLSHLSGIHQQENSVSHLNYLASIIVNILESGEKVKCCETHVF